MRRRIEIDGEGSDRTHRSLCDFLVLLVCAHHLPFLLSHLGGRHRGTDGTGDRQRQNRRGLSLFHGFLVLLVCADVLAGLLALLAPLALLVFVPPVAVALLAVVPPPATAARGLVASLLFLSVPSLSVSFLFLPARPVTMTLSITTLLVLTVTIPLLVAGVADS